MTIDNLLHFLYLTGGFSTRSNFARENAELVAEAASCGLITVAVPVEGTPVVSFQNVWRLTHEGHGLLWGICDCE